MPDVPERCQRCSRDARVTTEMPELPKRVWSMEEIKENLIKMTNVIIKSRARSDPGKYDIVSYGT